MTLSSIDYTSSSRDVCPIKKTSCRCEDIIHLVTLEGTTIGFKDGVGLSAKCRSKEEALTSPPDCGDQSKMSPRPIGRYSLALLLERALLYPSSSNPLTQFVVFQKQNPRQFRWTDFTIDSPPIDSALLYQIRECVAVSPMHRSIMPARSRVHKNGFEIKDIYKRTILEKRPSFLLFGISLALHPRACRCPDIALICFDPPERGDSHKIFPLRRGRYGRHASCEDRCSARDRTTAVL